MTKILSKVFLAISGLSLIVPFSIALLVQDPNMASANPVYMCATGETLVGMDCTIPVNTSNTFGTICPTGFTESYAVCLKKTAKACATFNKAEDDGTGMCKIKASVVSQPGNTSATGSPLFSEITDSDGRYCKAPGVGSVFNIKFYKVSANGETNPPTIRVCANIYSAAVGKDQFRFEPFEITEVGNYVTQQTGTTNSPCPSNYTMLNSTTCKRTGIIKACDAMGEYFASSTSSCLPCPAGQYCPMPNNNTTNTAIACVNGGTLSTDKTKCTAQNKVAITTYTDGCPAPMRKMDQTCATVENRNHDLACTYYYASSDVNVKAIQANDPATRTQDGNTYIMCSTGGLSSFSDTSIVKVSDLQCLGAGSAWYNYNVAYDPLVCGIGDPLNKTAFRWTALSFEKITPIQKIPGTGNVCPAGWLELDATTCYQAPVTIDYKGAIICPVNTYSMASAGSCTPCPNGGTSAMGSTMLSNCSTPVVPVIPPVVPVVPPVVTITPPVTTVITPPTVTLTIPTPVAPAPKVPCVSPMGSYTNSNGDCVVCPAGTMNSMVGSKSITDCIRILTCQDFMERGMGDFKVGDVNYSRERDPMNKGIACELPKAPVAMTITTVRTGGNQLMSMSAVFVAIVSGIIGIAMLKKESNSSFGWNKIK